MKKVCWFSCGATSAVACKLTLLKDKEAEVAYIETGSHHSDNLRFLRDCEKWFGKKIIILRSPYYNDVLDVIKKIRFINSPYGAACTTKLKTNVRQMFEYEHPELETYVWGFECTPHERERAVRMQNRYKSYKHEFPLIEKKLNKENCLGILAKEGIKLPEMYKLGYHNNNCIGCVKGGMGYWNRIRKDFPDAFKRMAEAEREIGHSCIKEYFLDELPKDAGRTEKFLEPVCGIFCGLINLEEDKNGI